ncbi:hypothetical protein RA261_27365, partial [Pseudomonas syringae pv. tagetis]
MCFVFVGWFLFCFVGVFFVLGVVVLFVGVGGFGLVCFLVVGVGVFVVVGFWSCWVWGVGFLFVGVLGGVGGVCCGVVCGGLGCGWVRQG